MYYLCYFKVKSVHRTEKKKHKNETDENVTSINGRKTVSRLVDRIA